MDGRTQIDHVIVGVVDVDVAVGRLEDIGLSALTRSEHPDLGTRNAVIPVGYGQFIELLAVADPDAGTPLVRALGYLLADGRDRMAGACLRPADLDAVAARLSLPVVAGERHEPDRVLRFRRTVVEANPQYPFFIEWDGDQDELDRRYGDPGSTDGIAWVEFGGDDHAVRGWVGDESVVVRTVDGPPGPRRFAIRCDGEEVVIE